MIKCENCGREFEDKNIIVSVKNGCDISFYCKQCNALFGHCPMCENYANCGFFEDPDPMPKFIMIQRKQQNEAGATIIMQCEVPNTERLHKFCLGGKCKCCNEDDASRPFCCRFTQYQTCRNYIEKKGSCGN